MEGLVTSFPDRDYAVKRRGLKVHQRGGNFRKGGVAVEKGGLKGGSELWTVFIFFGKLFFARFGSKLAQIAPNWPEKVLE